MSLRITHLTTELQKEPIGLDCAQPRFAWRMESDRPGAGQQSYRITVRTEDGTPVWDSGTVQNDRSVWVLYEGDALQPATEYVWTVTVKELSGETASASSRFETGLMCTSIDAWHGAQWIGADEYSLAAKAKGIFAVSATFRIEGKSAGLLFGVNDPRLCDPYKNDYCIAGENYIKYEITAEGVLHIYRVGYCPEDRADVPFASVAFAADGAVEGFDASAVHTLRVEVHGNGAYAYLDGVRIDACKREMPRFRIPGAGKIGDDAPRYMVIPRQLNPARDNDITTYPLLCDAGVFAEGKATFDSFTVTNIRTPQATLFELNADTIGTTAYAAQVDNGKIRVENGKLVVEDASAVADPSNGGIPMLRRDFSVAKPLKRARLYATSRGVYECHINGKRVGDRLFEPGADQYDKHLQYQTYDVTGYLQTGENALGFLLSSGWWNESQTFSLMNYNYWGDRQSLLSMLVLEYADGSAESIVTKPGEWKYRTDGPITFAGWFYGEHYDARRGWLLDAYAKPGFRCDKWKDSVGIPTVDYSEMDAGSGFARWPVPTTAQPELTGGAVEPIRHILTLTAQSMTEPRPGVYVYDMGQNMVGVPRITMRGKAGTQATLRYGEVLYPNLKEYEKLAGLILTENLRDAISIDRYTFGSDVPETYSPRCTFHGYRYIEVSGVAEAPKPSDVQGMVLSSIDALTGSFESSDPRVNRLFQNVIWSQRANFISIPTDCPQRNERMGWAGDAQVFARTATYNSNAYSFYRRWLGCMRDCQLPDGRYPDIAPVGGGFGGIEWGSAGIIVTYETWKQYGDARLIEENFESMCRYMDYLEKQGEPGKLTTVGPLGDWLASDMSTDSPLLWNAVYYHDANIMAEMALKIGKTEEADKYAKLAAEIKCVWNETFVDPASGKTRNMAGEINDTQCSYSLPLGYGVFNDTAAAAAQLARKTAEVGYTVTTGFVGTGPLCPSLCDAGYADAAYKLIRQTEYPSWLYSVTQGATTIWERWNSVTETEGFGGNNAMNSFNHYSLGAVSAWIYGYVLGIRRGAQADGFRNFVYRPEIGDLAYAKGHYESLYGRIDSAWEKKADGLHIRFSVPANTSATVILPAGRLTVNGVPAAECAQIRILRGAHSGNRFQAISGHYEFILS